MKSPTVHYSKNEIFLKMLSDVKAGGQLSFLFSCAHSPDRILSIQVLGPRGMNQGAIEPDDKGRQNVFYKRLTWTPTQVDAGQRIVCAIAEDITRLASLTSSVDQASKMA